jgi:hypothetical protein
MSKVFIKEVFTCRGCYNVIQPDIYHEYWSCGENPELFIKEPDEILDKCPLPDSKYIGGLK